MFDAIEYIPCNKANYGGRRKASEIKYIVYHYTANDGDTAKGNAHYYQTNTVKASAHYFVDDNHVIQSVQDLDVAWAVGGKKWADCGKTGGGKLYGVVFNSNSLSIEMCDTNRNGELMATEATLENAVLLGKYLMEKYNIPIDRVVRHFDVTGKYCPRYFMDNAKWSAFKARLVGEETEVLEPRYDTLAEIEKACPWAVETVQKLIAKGALTGDGTGLDLSYDMLRMFVINNRMGVYDV